MIMEFHDSMDRDDVEEKSAIISSPIFMTSFLLRQRSLREIWLRLSLR